MLARGSNSSLYLINRTKAGIPRLAWVSAHLINKKTGKFEYGRARKKALFLIAWRHTKQDLDLSLQSRLQRYGAGKMRALDMAKYITEFYDIKQNSVGRPSENKKLATKLQGCANYLVFKRYLTVDEVRLHAANFCKKHLLCPFCAMRRGAKYLQVYKQRLDVVLQENPNLRAFMVTLTVKDGENLSERFTHLRKSLKKYQQQRRDALKVKSRSNTQRRWVVL